MENKKIKRILVFGVFDNLHDGHKFFLKKSKDLGNCLIVVVTPMEIVQKLKNKTPKQSESERIESIKNFGIADEVLLGDTELGSWNIIKTKKPHIVAVGFDQIDLRKALEKVSEKYGFKIEEVGKAS